MSNGFPPKRPKVEVPKDVEELLKSDEFLVGLQIRGEALEKRLGRLRKLALRASSHLIGKGEKLAAKRTEIDSLKAEIAQLAELQKSNTTAKIQALRLSEEIARSQEVLQNLEDGKKAIEERAKWLEKSIHELEASAHKFESARKEKNDELQALNKEVEELWRRREQRREEVQVLEVRTDAEQRQLRSIIAETEVARAEKARQEGIHTQLQSDVKEFRTELERRQKIQEELVMLQGRRTALSEEVADLAKVQQQHVEITAELNTARKAHSHFSEDYDRMVTEHARMVAFAEQNSELELRNDALVRQSDELDSTYKNALQRNHEVEMRSMSLHSLLQEALAKEKLAMGALTAINVELTAKNSEFARLNTEIESAEERIAQALVEITGLATKNVSLRSESSRIEGEIADLEERFTKEETTRVAELEKRFIERATLQEKDLGARMHQVMQEIKKERQLWVEERSERRAQDMSAIRTALEAVLTARVLTNIQVDEERDQLRKVFMSDALDAIESIFDSKANPEENTQLQMGFAGLLRRAHESGHVAKTYLKKRIIQGGVFATLLLGAIIFPSIPRAVYQSTQKAISRSPASSNSFVEQVRQTRANRPKFLPQQDKTFRANFTDNMIYVLGYSELKRNPEKRQQWTLELDKFIQKDLDKDDRVIVGFASIESAFIDELETMRARIRPETQVEEIERMRNFEAKTAQRLGELVGGAEGLAKIRKFESEFYQRQSTELVP